MRARAGYKSDLNKRLEAETARKKVAKQLEEKEREEAEARAKKQQDAGKAPATGVADRDERAKKGAAALKKNGGVGQALQVLERSVAKLAPEYYKNAQAQLDALEKSTKKQTDQIKKGVWLDENVRVESLDKGAAAIEGMSEQAEAAFSSLLDGGSLTEMLSGAGESVAEWAMSKAAEAVCAKSQQVVDKVAKDLAARGAAAAGSGGAAAADGAGGGGSWNAACAKPGSPTEDQKKSFVEKKSTALQEIKDEVRARTCMSHVRVCAMTL